MADENPLEPIARKITNIRSALLDFVRNVLGKIKPLIRMLFDFVKQVRANLAALIEKVGKTYVNNLLKFADRLFSLFPVIEKMAMGALKFAEKLLAVIKKAADPAKIFKTVKALVARLAKMFRDTVSKIMQFVMSVAPISAALRLIDTFKMVLRMIMAWITSVSGVLGAVKKVEALLKKASKTLQRQLKDVTLLVKEANKLKPA